MNSVHENDLIEGLTKRFKRSPIQLNRRQESDAELVLLPSSPDCVLAVTTDSLVEEIASGLYDDPYLAGWMSVMVNMSDLAAVGASPLGLLISEVLPGNLDAGAIERLQQGIQDACEACGTHVLGGDTNSGERLVMTGTAFGVCLGRTYLSRTGCKPGDLLFATGPLGGGNAFALHRFAEALRSGTERLAADRTAAALLYRPQARVREGESLCGIATACMDTSDGVIATLDQLMRLNRTGFELTDRWEGVLDPRTCTEFEAHGLPAWAALAGQHGEFELLFTVPRCDRDILMESSSRAGWKPLELGAVIAGNEAILPLDGFDVSLDTTYLRNLSSLCGSDVQSYARALLAYDTTIRNGVRSDVDS